MPQLRTLLLLCVMTAAWSSIAVPGKHGHAQPADATVTTSLLRPFDPPAPIAVEYEEDTEINSRLAEVIANDLHRRGFVVVDRGSAITLRVSTGVPELTKQPPPSVGIEGRGGTASRTTITGNVRIPLGREGQTGLAPPSRSEIAMLLRDSNNTVLWSGRAEAYPPVGDHYETLSRMVPVLLDRMGKSVANETVPLP